MARARRAPLVGLGGLLVSLVLLAAACGGTGASGSGSQRLSVGIASPANGATVSVPFTVKLRASVPLGDPGTGKHHVHLCFDGKSCDSEYTLAYGSSIPVSGLAPGRHTMTASLRNADHSDAGPTDTVTITVTRAAGGTGSPTPSSSSRYGY